MLSQTVSKCINQALSIGPELKMKLPELTEL